MLAEQPQQLSGPSPTHSADLVQPPAEPLDGAALVEQSHQHVSPVPPQLADHRDDVGLQGTPLPLVGSKDPADRSLVWRVIDDQTHQQRPKRLDQSEVATSGSTTSPAAQHDRRPETDAECDQRQARDEKGCVGVHETRRPSTACTRLSSSRGLKGLTT